MKRERRLLRAESPGGWLLRGALEAWKSARNERKGARTERPRARSSVFTFYVREAIRVRSFFFSRFFVSSSPLVRGDGDHELRVEHHPLPPDPPDPSRGRLDGTLGVARSRPLLPRRRRPRLRLRRAIGAARAKHGGVPRVRATPPRAKMRSRGTPRGGVRVVRGGCGVPRGAEHA